MLSIHQIIYSPQEELAYPILGTEFNELRRTKETSYLTFIIDVERFGRQFPVEVHLSVIELEKSTKLLLSADTILARADLMAGLRVELGLDEKSPAVKLPSRMIIEIPHEKLFMPGTIEIQV